MNSVMKTLTQLLIQHALKEDIPVTDVTSDCLFDSNYSTTATIYAKESGIFYGEALIQGVFEHVDPSVIIHQHIHDGDSFEPKSVICDITGPALSLLKGERTCLNFIQHLSGIATQTHRFVSTLNDNSIDILDTRKTTPGLRQLEKAAVVAGGGKNHRFNLSDMVLIKENHLSHFLKTHPHTELKSRLSTFKKKNPSIPIEIEIESPDQLKSLDLSDVDFILFDNFSIDMIHEGLAIASELRYKAKIEISGNVTLDTVARYRGLGIDRISVGSLTHSVKSIDFSMLIVL